MNIPFADALLYRYVASQAGTPLPAYQPEQLAGTRRVLLMLTTGLGDAILSTPVFPAIRAALPQADIRLFCRRAWAPLFDADPDLNGVIAYPGKFRNFFSTVHALRQFAPELTVILHGNDPDIVPLAWLAGSRHIIRVPTRGTRYTFLLANRDRADDASTAEGLHYIENRLRVLDTLGIKAAEKPPSVHLPDRARQATVAKLARIVRDRPYWVLHPFAADPYKNWPFTTAAELIVEARRKYPEYAVLVTGTAADRRLLETLVTTDKDVHVVAGELEIVETAAALAMAACVVAPDTGILHLAAALQRPVVGLYAPTQSSLVGPRNSLGTAIALQKPRTCDPCLEKRCPFTPKNCMNQIGVSEVLNALGSRLNVG